MLFNKSNNLYNTTPPQILDSVICSGGLDSINWAKFRISIGAWRARSQLPLKVLWQALGRDYIA